MLKKATFLPTQPWRAKTRLAPGKAAASEEVQTALRVGRSPLESIAAKGKSPPVIPTSEKLASIH